MFGRGCERYLDMRKAIYASLLLSSSLVLSACAEAAEEPANEMMGDEAAMAEADLPGTIVDVASGNDDFSTLVAAVTAADLAATLSGVGPFTVFAPTNAAFDKLPDGVVDNLVANDAETLGSILTYHVVAGEVDAATLIAAIEGAGDEGYMVQTVNGTNLTATLVDGSVMLTDAVGGTATVTATDIDASNGLIHVIDTVLMPM